ncbi:MAG: glutamine--fructose-6-phosphate transaminase (isomerizing) [Elusimicrobiota bacterium]
MCGIIGYIGQREAAPLLIEGLRRLEYRGYDSAGICVISDAGKFGIVREVGKIARLSEKLIKHPVKGTSGVGHTRWSTHGAPNHDNAHPHTDCTGGIVLVHNGIIENYLELKAQLLAKGHRFQSDTDTEVVAHLFEEQLFKVKKAQSSDAAILAVARAVLSKVKGSYALVVSANVWDGKIIGLRKECPLVAGKTQDEVFLASDIPALLPFTKEVVFIEDGEAVILKPGAHAPLYKLTGQAVRRDAVTVPWDNLMAAKGGHKHFMHKEIYDGPASFEDTLRGRIYDENIDALLRELGLNRSKVKGLGSINILGCGTAYYAGLVGEYIFEHFAGLRTHVEIASEFRYRERITGPGTLALAISQSGETADTLAAMKLLKARSGVTTAGIINQIGSTMTRTTGGTLYTRCGPEIGVASTKAFVAQLATLYLSAFAFGRVRGVLSAVEYKSLCDGLVHLSSSMRMALQRFEPLAKDLAARFQNAKGFLYLGRHVMYPVALEGALKLKEISYIHAEGYASGEMKHGPIALIDEQMPVFAFVPKSSSVYAKTASNLEEARARGAKIIAVASEGDKGIYKVADHVFESPKSMTEWFDPVIGVIAAQLFAYHVANLKGLDVDQPRNLAKSVTVE